ncbi:MAG: 2-amino-4-hydroxy-6-hydroxymethyldihydropteridine diphosphokinase [Magnetococcales bacterium]|nr:2-amino-4-hydroxy-6-hydroxymethyldihydropteridine diphosphokinase [Magnetococcales bacterium]NGZ07319.1 2-amino-4-hydroxy-6-hydroxymethyldihydropteridine diphosphokinase [Magnetococcales bacterium]
MNTPILIAFGSNIEPEKNLAFGMTRLHALFGVKAISTIYRTRALRTPSTPTGLSLPDFLNGALTIQTEPDPWTLRQTLKSIEQESGRVPGQPGWAPRTLDLDIALMGGLQLNTPNLTIPDPDIPTRPFLAIPLAELAPTLIHPILKVSLNTLATRLVPDPTNMWPDPHQTALFHNLLTTLPPCDPYRISLQ